MEKTLVGHFGTHGGEHPGGGYCHIASTAITNNKTSNTFKSFKTDVAMVMSHFKPSWGCYDSKMLDLSDIFFLPFIHLFSIKFLMFLFARLH